jgi:DNA repair exonuclease SbcCD nuclease subunit
VSSFCFVHAADLHLDTPLEGISTATGQVREALIEASLHAWDHLVELCIAEDAAFLLLAGDIYDGVDRGVRAQLRFLRGLERLSERGIQTFVVHGNHDPVEEGWSAIIHWPAGVTILDHTDVQTVSVERDGRCLATVTGISYARRETSENLALRFRPRHLAAAASPAADHSAALRIGLLHCSAISSSEHLPYSPCSLADLRQAPIDYWALGHIHKRQTLGDGTPVIAYPGNLQGRSMKPSETDAKGALVVECADGRVANVRFHACDALRFAALHADVSTCADISDVLDELLQAAERRRAEESGLPLVVRATVDGRGPAHSLLARPGVLPSLLEELRERSVAQLPFLWWDALSDATRPQIDRDQIRERHDFAAQVVAEADALLADPIVLRHLLDELNRELPLRRLPEALRQLPDEDLVPLMAAAETIALDLLTEEDEQ